MGLLDQVIGSVVGSKSPGGQGGMSPLVKAMMMLLAAKAASSYFGKSEAQASTSAHAGAAAGGAPPAPSGKVESGILAGMPSLDSLLGHFRSSGHGDTVDSWVGSGANKPIGAQDVEKTLGADTISHLEKETGLPRDQLLKQLAEALPKVVDKLTPDGRLPTPQERAHW